jgi:hypothetical protein
MKETCSINQVKMEFREVYCSNCKKVIGRYNIKFYNDDKIEELLNTTHSAHIRNGHQVAIRKFEKN